MDIFGSRWKDHTNRIRQEWEAVVTPDDTVVIPGDISWAMSLEDAKADFAFIHALPGRKLIGKGNHDYWWTTMTKMRAFTQENGFSSIDFLFNNAYVCEDCIVCGSRLLPGDQFCRECGAPR